MTVLQFALLGLGIGAPYGLAALGIVLIHRGSGVINLAHGAVGMVGTYVFWYLHDERNQNFLVAYAPAMVVCALIGVVVQQLVMRPLRSSSPVSRLLATLGVLATLQGAVALKYPDEVKVVASSLPTSALEFGDLRVGKDRLAILVIGVVLAIVLGAFYKFTRFGIATTAVAENESVASHLGFSPNSIASANWALGSVLAGTAGVLLAPITGLQTTSLTLVVVPALAAALTGAMSSFSVTFLAGLLIGVAQSLLTRYVSTPGWGNAVPFILVVAVLVLRGTALPARGETSLRLPSIGSGRIRWIPSTLLVVLTVVLIQTVPPDWVDGINLTILSAIILMSVVIVTGFAGQVSLAQIALAGSTTLIASRLIADKGVPFLLALVLGTLVAIPIGVLVALPALRARGSNLAIVTLTMSVAIEAVVLNRESFTGGDVGVQIGSPTIFGLEVDNILHARRYAVVGLVAFVLVALVVANLRRSRTGRRLVAVRANERAAASLGVSVVGAKIYAFALSSSVAALGGMLLAFRQPSVVFNNYHSFDAVTYVANAVIGGVGQVLGPIAGSTLTIGGVGTNISDLLGEDVQKYVPVVGGIILILVLIQNPDGIAASVARDLLRLRSRFTRETAPPTESDLRTRYAMVRSDDTLDQVERSAGTLQAKGISVRFGSTYALKNVDLEVRPGEVVGLIGPNGSGKTTLIDALTGFVQMASGSVTFNGDDLRGWSPRKRGAAGISRSFQSLELFEDMTVMENLLVACEQHSVWANVSDLVAPGSPQLPPEAVAAIDRFELWGDLQSRPSQMPHGRRRLLAIARSIASQPRVLLLDEPASGLNPKERAELSSLIRALAQDVGIGVLLIEHDVELVMRTSDRLIALEFGRVIAQGSPAEVRNHPDVVRSYLGAESTDDELTHVDGTV